MKVLITGANGQVGWELQQTSPQGWDLISLNRAQLDITDNSAVTNSLQQHRPDLVINTAAYTAVDKAESEHGSAFAVNAQGAANIAAAANEFQARLIHLSTDFVFDGSKSLPYFPDDQPNPLSIYGASKLQGEQAVMNKTQDNALILRTSWLYSRHGSNFVKTMLRFMAERDELRVIADQVGTPTWAGDLAKAIWNFASRPSVHGIYHWTDAGVASWYDFAVAIQEEAHDLGFLQNTIAIVPVRTIEYPTPAKRPSYSVLDKTATWGLLGYHARHWRKSLRMMLMELNEEWGFKG